MSEYHNRAKKIQKYLDELFAHEDEVLIKTREHMEKNGLQLISVTPLIGKTLSFLAQLIGAERILEIGTLGGYSAIWLGRSLPDKGTLISLESDPNHIKVALENIQRAQLENMVEIRQGRAMETMKTMISSETEPFDLIFLDADKPSYPEYIEPMITLTRPGGLIIADNLIRRGKVLDPPPHDKHAKALALFNKLIAAHPRLESIMIPSLVGYIGGDLDGLSISKVLK